MYYEIYNNKHLIYNPLVIHYSNCNMSLDSCKCDKLEHVDSIYLGVIFDRNLRWTAHINHVVSMIRKLFYKFKLLKDILNTNSLRTVYLALVQSIINYGIVVWGNASKFALNPLIITLNSLLRFILLKPYDFHVDDFYRTFNVRNLNGLYIWNILNYIFNMNLKEYYLSHIAIKHA